MPDNGSDEDILQTDRFRIESRLGRGGMGVVYRAFDRERHMYVALKTIRQPAPATIVRFKREFRALADVSHPNLVTLYELVLEEERFFFTMELLQGVNLIRYVWGDEAPRDELVTSLGSMGQSSRAPTTPLYEALAEARTTPLQRAEAPTTPLTEEGAGPASGPRAEAPTTPLTEEGAGPAPGPRAEAQASTADVDADLRQKVLEGLMDGTKEIKDAPGAATLEEKIVQGVVASPGTRPPPGVRLDRLRPVMLQLVDGVCALHDSGHLHRDIKPSNVVVTPEERVVLLDFGVIGELRGSMPSPDLTEVAGTPTYMAPEVAAGVGATQASDWYSVGVMLYLALVGRLPFRGEPSLVRHAKLHVQPTPVLSLRPDCPAGLAGLCDDLLSIDPHRRPTPRQIRRRLGERRQTGRVRPLHVTPDQPPIFVGRDAELRQLAGALQRTREQKTGTVVHVHAESGLGKSTLVRRFLQQVGASDQPALVLTGRCYERESLPYKAVDALVDELARYLNNLGQEERRQLLPPDMFMLARLFPVLGPRGSVDDKDLPPDREIRRRAFAALRRIFIRLARRRPVVLFIDDAQWGDEDSALILQTLMRAPAEPALMLILSYRTDEARRSPLLLALEDRESGLSGQAGQLRIHLQPLSEQHVRLLAGALLADTSLSEQETEVIARESGGNPYFVHELVRFQQSRLEEEEKEEAAEDRQVPSAARLDVTSMIRHRVSRLSEPERHLLEIVAVAGQPLPQHVAQRAAYLRAQERADLFVRLQAAQLIRLSGRRDTDLIEPYHDRIRETVVDHLSDKTRKAHHLSIALTLQSSEAPDVEMLARHFEAACQPEQALRYVLLSARHAEQSLAFIQAAELYRRALELRPACAEDAGPDVIELTLKLGDALAGAGHGADAARSFLDAASLAGDAEALSLTHRAADELVRAGYIDRGLDLLQQVLAREHTPLPRTPRRALASLLWRRAMVRMTGLGFRQRPGDQLEQEQLARADLFHSVGAGLVMLDNIRGADFQARGLLLARRSGDPFRFCRALTIEGGYASTAGGQQKRARRLLARARSLADQLDDPYLDTLVTGVQGIAAFQGGHWSEGYALNARAEGMLLERLTGVAWELDMVRLFKIWSLVFLGRFAELSMWVRRYIQEARDRGDLYAVTNMRSTLSNLVWLMDDDVDEARRQAGEAIDQWSQRGFFMQHYYDLLARGNIELYCGRGRQTRELIGGSWPRVRQVMLHMIQYVRITLFDMHARGALAEAAEMPGASSGRRRLLRLARRNARRLESERVAWSVPLGQLIRGQAALIRGDAERAREHLERARGGFEQAEMTLHLEVTRRRLGELLGGERGQEMIERADRYMLDQGIARPERMTAVFAPVSGVLPSA